MELARCLIVVVFGIIHGCYALQINRKYQICSHVGHPLVIGCGPQEFIYMNKVILSDWPWYTGRECDPPLCSQFCHVYSTKAFQFYNGRQTAEYTFYGENLNQYKETYGHCNISSTAKFVFIVYECVSENVNSICHSQNRHGDTEGHITSPGFPSVNSMATGWCQCDLESSNKGSLYISSIVLNPFVGRGRTEWTLKVVGEHGKTWDLNEEAGINNQLTVPMTTKMTLIYEKVNDQSMQHLFFSHQPPGFWLKYAAFPLYSKINVHCYTVENPILSTSSIVLIVLSCVLTIGLLATCVILIRKWLQKKGKAKNTDDDTSFSSASQQTTENNSCSDVEVTEEYRTTSKNSLPVIYHGQNFRQIRLVELDPKRHSEKKRRKKNSVQSTSSFSSSTATIMDIRDCRGSREPKENDTYFAFDLYPCYFEAGPDSEINV